MAKKYSEPFFAFRLPIRANARASDVFQFYFFASTGLLSLSLGSAGLSAALGRELVYDDFTNMTYFAFVSAITYPLYRWKRRREYNQYLERTFK